MVACVLTGSQLGGNDRMEIRNWSRFKLRPARDAQPIEWPLAAKCEQRAEMEDSLGKASRLPQNAELFDGVYEWASCQLRMTPLSSLAQRGKKFGAFRRGKRSSVYYKHLGAESISSVLSERTDDRVTGIGAIRGDITRYWCFDPMLKKIIYCLAQRFLSCSVIPRSSRVWSHCYSISRAYERVLATLHTSNAML